MSRTRKYLDEVFPRVVARQDEAYRPVRQLNEAVNRSHERVKSRATTPRQKLVVSQKQENYNVAQRRQRQVTTKGYAPTKKEQQQYKLEDIKRAKRHRVEKAFNSDKPIVVQTPQAQLWDKNKVDLAKTQQAFYRDAAANIGVNWGNNLDPYSQSDLVNNAAQSFGMSNLTPYTLPAFGSLTPSMAARTFVGSGIGSEVGGLVGSQIGSTISDNSYAPLIGGIAGGIVGGGVGNYIPNRSYVRLANAVNNNIRNANVNLQYIRPDFNRFKLGDVEINNPSLYYRQGSTRMGDDFLNTGVVREGGGYANPMFARGKLWYGIPTKEMLTQGRQVKVGKFNLTKANEASPKTDLLVSTGEMVPSNAKAMPKSSIQTKKRLHPYSEADIKNAKTNSMREFMLDFNDKYYNGELNDLANVTYVDTEMVRRIPANGNSANAKNTTLYRYEPGYGYRKVRTKDNIANYNVFMTDAADKYPYIIPNYTDDIEKLKSIANYQGNHMDLTKQRLNNGGYMQLQFLQDAKDRLLRDDDVWQMTTAYGIHPTERFPYDDYNINRLNNLKATIIDDPTQQDAFFDIHNQKMFRQRNPKRKDLFDTPHKIDIADSHEFAHAVIPMPEFNISPKAFNASRASYLGQGNNMEVAARGTQLKNYFGLDYSGDGLGPNDIFTEDMLKYAAKHYVKDTGIDNNMSEMFFRINDWKEVADWIHHNSPGLTPIGLGLGYKLINKKNKTKTN